MRPSRSDRVGQRVDVGRKQLARLAILEHLGDDGVLGREGRERCFVGGELAGLGFLRVGIEREFAEQHLAKLLGRADVELAAGVLVDRLLEPRRIDPQLFADFPERNGVEPDAFVFHRGENGQQR